MNQDCQNKYIPNYKKACCLKHLIILNNISEINLLDHKYGKFLLKTLNYYYKEKSEKLSNEINLDNCLKFLNIITKYISHYYFLEKLAFAKFLCKFGIKFTDSSLFREHPDILKGTEKPDYNRCIDIATKASLKEMILPGVIAVGTPILVGVLLGKEGLGALLIGALASSIMLAIFMANAGGAWDNAKKYIESMGMKGTEAHHASVTGDTVGDPLKDTAGPTMDILIKMMSVIALIMAPMLSSGFSVWSLIVK